MNRSLPLTSAASFLTLLLLLCISCQKKPLKSLIIDELDKEKGVFAVAFKDLSTGEEVLINERQVFHAASTMKTPVMIEIFKLAGNGKLSLSDSLIIKNRFKSIVDSSHYSLDIGDDSDSSLYLAIGQKRTIADLLNHMITVSSNLATNILIAQTDPESITQTMRELGAKDMQVLRGVEDQPAFDIGINNTITAYDLMIVFEKLAEGKVVSKNASDAMISILKQQKFNELIPAGLPPDAVVAHKTGWLKGVQHDAGIVFLPNGKKYVLILLSKNLENDQDAVRLFANVSKIIYNY